MIRGFLIAIFVASTLVSCNETKEVNGNERVYWINSYKVDCVGVAPMSCFQVIKGEEFHEDHWEYFYSNIEGFEFEPGYLYKVLISEEKLDPKNVPADASSIKYTLIRVMEKKSDPKLRINDIWALEQFGGKDIASSLTEGIEIPRIEFNVAKMLFMGTDGCNNFSGEIKHLGDKLILLGPAAGTRKMCKDMTVSSELNTLIQHVKSYKVDNMKLYLMDDGGKELLVYKKVD